jgi:hypothetical protein
LKLLNEDKLEKDLIAAIQNNLVSASPKITMSSAAAKSGTNTSVTLSPQSISKSSAYFTNQAIAESGRRQGYRVRSTVLQQQAVESASRGDTKTSNILQLESQRIATLSKASGNSTPLSSRTDIMKPAASSVVSAVNPAQNIPWYRSQLNDISEHSGLQATASMSTKKNTSTAAKTYTSYEEAAEDAERLYTTYQKAKKAFNKTYGRTSDPELSEGYEENWAELEQLQTDYLSAVTYMQDYADTVDTTATLTFSGTAADREPYQQTLIQMQQELEQYLEESDGEPDPAILANYHKQISSWQKALDTLPTESKHEEILNQVLGGNYSEDVTVAGTLAQLGLSTIGWDTPGDIRDLSYDLSHLNTTPWGQTAIDAIALLPLIGSIKQVGQLGELAKIENKVDTIADALDDASDIAKNSSKLVDTAEDVVYNSAKVLDSIELKPTALMEELAQSGVKYTAEDVVMVTKSYDSSLMWLEKGNDGTGLTHILMRHEDDFIRNGITAEQIPEFLRSILNTEPTRKILNGRGYMAQYTFSDKNYRIIHGTNGYIVSFFPWSAD